ncbi:TAP-like domain-containing protein [Trichoderma novae-zelandiae]
MWRYLLPLLLEAATLSGASPLAAVRSNGTAPYPVPVPAPAPVRPPSAPQEFDWPSLVPSRQLEYRDCYGGGFQCARLLLPLDWQSAGDNRTVAVAVVRLPAAVPASDPAFGGSVFVNPGGPGASGVNYLVRHGATLRRVLVDKPGVRHYEVVSFDPRGVGRTTPVVDCFGPNDFARTAWNLQDHARGSLTSGPGAVINGLSLAKSLSLRCEREAAEAMAYVNTPSVARDMAEMVDQIDELRKREAASNGSGSSSSNNKPRHGAEEEGDPTPRLQYIGFSYGTVLGNAFASMFPGRVGRIVLDGVADAEDYFEGDGWLTNLQDTDTIFEEFWEGCFKSDNALCPFRETDDSPKKARKRFWSWVSDLDDAPAPIYRPNGALLRLTGDDVLRVVGSALYQPRQQFQPLALALFEGIGGNLTRVASWADTGVPQVADACAAGSGAGPGPGPGSPLLPPPKDEGGFAVLCGDGTDVTDRGAGFWKKYAKKQGGRSKVLGVFWAGIRLTCSSWPARPSWSFHGPFATPEHSARPLYGGKPAAPLLFLSSRLDPVTPLKGARAMAKEHPGAGLVIQESMGHGAWGSAPSRCTWRIVADYLHSGVVPGKETVCRADCGPWDHVCDAAVGKRSGEADVGEWEAMHLGEDLQVRRFPLGLE